MTLVFLWNRYKQKWVAEDKFFYEYRQFCEHYARWCEDNYETTHFEAMVGQQMEVNFAGNTFCMTDSLTGEIMSIVVFVAVLPYSQHIYVEGMSSDQQVITIHPKRRLPNAAVLL